MSHLPSGMGDPDHASYLQYPSTPLSNGSPTSQRQFITAKGNKSEGTPGDSLNSIQRQFITTRADRQGGHGDVYSGSGCTKAGLMALAASQPGEEERGVNGVCDFAGSALASSDIVNLDSMENENVLNVDTSSKASSSFEQGPERILIASRNTNVTLVVTDLHSESPPPSSSSAARQGSAQPIEVDLLTKYAPGPNLIGSSFTSSASGRISVLTQY